MNIDAPNQAQLPALRQLWQAVFRDPDEFLDAFFSTAFSPRRCRRVMLGDALAAALYWFDTTCRGQKLAYLYAVATAEEYRGRGLCRALLEQLRQELPALGYQGILLVPETPSLGGMYEKMGYRFCTTVSQCSCEAAAEPTALRQLSRAEYARLRRSFLPRGGVIQEGENLAFLETMSKFYAGDGFLLSVREEEGVLRGDELLGDTAKAPQILTALGCSRGTFRIPGGERPLAMFLPLSPEAQPPAWFGLPFD